MPVNTYKGNVGVAAPSGGRLNKLSDVVQPFLDANRESEAARLSDDAINYGHKTGRFFEIDRDDAVNDEALLKAKKDITQAEYNYYATKMNDLDTRLDYRTATDAAGRAELLKQRKEERDKLLQGISNQRNRDLLSMQGSTQDEVFKSNDLIATRKEKERDRVVTFADGIASLETKINTTSDINALGALVPQIEEMKVEAIENDDVSGLNASNSLMTTLMSQRLQLRDDHVRETIFNLDGFNLNDDDAAEFINTHIESEVEWYQSNGDNRTKSELRDHLNIIASTGILERAYQKVPKMKPYLSPEEAARWPDDIVMMSGLDSNKFLNQTSTTLTCLRARRLT